MFTPEQIAAHKAHIDDLFALGKKSVEGAQALADLHTRTALETLQRAASAAKQAAEGHDVHAAIAGAPAQLEQAAARSLEYSRAAAGVAVEMTRAMQSYAKSCSQHAAAHFGAAVESAARGAQDGSARDLSAGVATAIQSAMNVANKAYDAAHNALSTGAAIARAGAQAASARRKN
jgi:hypothetical protein